MKFAKELEQDLVPEWRIKYLNYKTGKKYVKAVSRAINRANSTPLSLARRSELPPRRTPSTFNIGSPFSQRQRGTSLAANSEEVDPLRSSPAPIGTWKTKPQTPARAIPAHGQNERDGLTDTASDLQYGSFVATPPGPPAPIASRNSNNFELPAPAIRVPSNTSEPAPRPTPLLRHSMSRMAVQRSASMAAAVHSSGSQRENTDGGPTPSIRLPRPATGSLGGGVSPRAGLRRLFTAASPLNRSQRSQIDIGMQSFAQDVVRQREREFFQFMDKELEKVEAFYKLKETQAADRLTLLREQLHVMRNTRTHELAEERRRREHEESNGHGEHHHDDHAKGQHAWMDPIKSKIFKPGPNSKALQRMAHTPVMGPHVERDAGRDYIRRPVEHEVPYRTAKRKLKLALQEFYRGLELLKSFALLNRTAFRKLNKKYDKAVNARPAYRYMSEKVNKSWFVNSDLLDGQIKAVEDLYARYFERGNHKLAVGKLRSLSRRPGDESGSAFRCGILIGTGLVFAIQGAAFGGQLLFHEDETVRLQTAYLMQIYAGYFLMLFLFSLFCIDCHIWSKNKINYPFIFEFDPRHSLDWRQLAEFPSFFLFVFGLFIWLNFSRYGTPAMFIYYPVILIFVTLLIILLPAPILWHRSRRWFAYAHWRLLLAGIYPVEFRDFFLGDIYCSLTYATCNVELFFCVYANYWDNPVECNSNHSRLLGFFGALPPIWRFLQCIRRYKDTGNVFPHLVNGGKYSMSILAAVTLSLYRIQGSQSNLALFITFATINAIYCTIWDLFMDFSLLQPHARYYLLRDITALKKRWVYYFVMVVDPILRFAWIFYAIFTHDTQHSSIISFSVSFAEVARRGLWTIFRVENEHCANVAQYKASRDVPLPYRIEPLVERESMSPEIEPETSAASARSTGVQRAGAERVAEEETGSERVEEGSSIRRRKADTSNGPRNFSKILAEAHRQDFEKKRKPVEEGGEDAEEREALHSDDDDDDDEDDDDDDGAESQNSMDMREVEGLVRNDREEGDQGSAR